MAKNFIRGLVAGIFATGAAVAGYTFFGPNRKSNRLRASASFTRMKDEIAEELGRAKEISRETYDFAVDAVISRYEKGKSFTEDEVEVLRLELRNYWDDIRPQMEIIWATSKDRARDLRDALKSI